MVNSDFSSLLNQALSEPGMIHSAYSAFHNYSMGNALLAAFECASRNIPVGPINTYKGWQSLDRQVRKGEKAISLIMPITAKRKAEKTEESAETEEKIFTRFMLRPNWFVLSQTDGEPIETPSVPEWNESQALESLGIERVPFESTDGNVQGYAREKQVAVSPVAALPHKTLFHELAHIALGHTGQFEDSSDTPKNIREVEAESVAYLCCASLNLPGLEYSRGYIQHWLTGNEINETTARHIFKATDAILKAGAPKAGVPCA